jgi:hypothetical protein
MKTTEPPIRELPIEEVYQNLWENMDSIKMSIVEILGKFEESFDAQVKEAS